MHGSINVKSIVLLQRDQQMHTLEQNYHKVLISKLLNIPPSGSAELYITIIQTFCHSQYVELLQVRQCMSIEKDMCTVIGAACRSYCNNFIVVHGMENVKFVVLFFTPVSVPGN